MSKININSLDHDFIDYYSSVSTFDNSLSLMNNPKPFYLQDISESNNSYIIIFLIICLIILMFYYYKKFKK